jgi:hypothetical protein
MPTKKDEWRGFIRALVYPIQFEADPVNGIDRVVEQVVDDPEHGFEREDFRAAIAKALASDAPLAALIEQDHGEAVIRRYLEALSRKLAGEG